MICLEGHQLGMCCHDPFGSRHRHQAQLTEHLQCLAVVGQAKWKASNLMRCINVPSKSCVWILSVSPRGNLSSGHKKMKSSSEILNHPLLPTAPSRSSSAAAPLLSLSLADIHEPDDLAKSSVWKGEGGAFQDQATPCGYRAFATDGPQPNCCNGPAASCSSATRCSCQHELPHAWQSDEVRALCN